MICCVYRRGRFYWGKLQLPHEVRLSRFSLGTTDRRVAQANLLQIAKDREMERAGLLAPSAVREATEFPVADLVTEFLAQLQVRGRMPCTLKKYRSNLLGCAAACGWKTLRDVTARSFCEWRTHCGLSGKTINDTLGALQVFARWLVFQRRLLESPFAQVDRIDLRGAQVQHRRALGADELTQLLTVAPENRRVVYLAAACTGLRRKELKRLRWGDVVFDGAIIRVRAATTKNRRDAVLPMCPELVAALAEHRPAHAAPFTPVFRTLPNNKTVRRDFRAAGITLLDEGGRRADFHALRVTFGTNLTLAGASPREAMELMRHSDIKLTMRIYTDAGKLSLASVVAKLPAVGVSRNVSTVCPKTCPDGGREGSEAVAL